MKRNLTLLVSAMLLLISTTSLKASSPKTYQMVMTDLANALIKNDYKAMNVIMKEGTSLKMPRENKVMTNTKEQLIALMRKQKEVNLNCSYTIDYLSNSDAIVIARFDMKFKDFTAYHYVTLEKNEEGNWEVTNLYKLFNKEQNKGKDLALISN